MRYLLPNIFGELEPLHTLLEEVYTSVGKRMKRSLRNFKLCKLWEGSKTWHLRNQKNCLHRSPCCSFPRRATIYLSVHGRIRFSLGGDPYSGSKPADECGDRGAESQTFFLSGGLKGPKFNCTMHEKESCAVKE